MSSVTAASARSLAVFAMLALAAPALAQQYGGEVDPEIRVQQLEERLRALTGQNEELQFRNRRLEDQLRQLQGNAGGQSAPGNAAAAPPPAASQQQPVYNQSPQQSPGYGQQPPGQVYGQQPQPQAPIVQDQAAAPPPSGRRRGDAFDPSQNPQAPGVPRALGGGQLPIPSEQGGNLPGRDPGAPIDLSNANSGRYPDAGAQQAPRGPAGGGLATLPPSATPRDEFDLGIGYMQRRDYALAEETMRNFATKYPNDALTPDSQYWLGESYFQRQMYRDSAEAFLAVTSKYDKSAKAPDALLRLGQSLSALKEKEAACAALGEIGRKYPKASAGVKKAVDTEQKKLKC
ncbi:conserved hypothetical protein [Rhodopseudomonas palustris BisB5]|uniref:Cell division coordinator CpoB n=1 Tax=Rhodopseudomonas palustris (strain BisB5) TaxID=316057 RepID=Q130X7_RHOPS|nr:conserved hypothetical protein [Rhodopseudomonas palustris BisB5]